MKLDPTRTITLRRRFVADMKRRFRKLARDNKKLIVDDDVFGLSGETTLLKLEHQVEIQANQERQAWRFLSNPNKVTAYRQWLQQQIDAGILSVDATGKPWTATYVESAYRKGTVRAYTDLNAERLASEPTIFTGGRAEFLRSSFMQPETLSKVELLSTRAFTELKGVTDTVSQQMSRILSNGLASGRGPIAIARQMTEAIGSLSRTRAEVIARTETIAAHAEGQLDAFQRLGEETVGVEAEWSTAGDERVCPLCAPLDGVIMPIEEARGLLPRHPNCRCSWSPARKAQRAAQRKKRIARKRSGFKDSIAAERTKGTFKSKKAKSPWLGKERL